ncbi:MAG: UDP-N-acetylglucosamine 1-carboxyvinyltransferase [Bryobacterales bacterium]|nr:UDP-N-acetylglucosamine 1-carboxyvinyltransferase [Bryobacterales bacterium]
MTNLQAGTSVAEEAGQLILRGGRPLRGEVAIRGAKNSLPKIMVAALLTGERCILRNVADIQDVAIVSELIEALGGSVARPDAGVIEIESANLKPMERSVLKEFSGRSRIPILLCGPLLARFGVAQVPSLGGCRIGSRPVDFHIDALQRMGAILHDEPGAAHLTSGKLHGNKIRLEYPSVGATEQVILAAVRAEGVTELSNAAIEPEILDLIMALQKMGAIIAVDVDRVITIIGVNSLRGFDHTAMPDRLEAASWASAAMATNGRIFVRGARQVDMMTYLNEYRQIGGDFSATNDGIEFWRAGDSLRSIALETDVHPGFMTDWQQPFVVTLTQAEGVSIVHETVYEQRFGYVKALNRMGAKIQLYHECLGSRKCRFGQRNWLHSAVIVGPTPLKGAEINIPDLRAGFSYVIAALAAEGNSTLTNTSLIQRGYENLIPKLTALGAEILG